MARPGGRIVLVGIPGDDGMELRASTFRRKGLELIACRRMRHAYPRCIELARRRAVDLHGLITHTVPLAEAAEILALNASYRDGIVKAAVRVSGSR
jgi:L-iditol 2-dehydrogenase